MYHSVTHGVSPHYHQGMSQHYQGVPQHYQGVPQHYQGSPRPHQPRRQPVLQYQPAQGQFRAPLSAYAFTSPQKPRGRCESNYCRTWSKKRRSYNDASSVCSLRTDSNSSASAVDENLNERRDMSRDMSRDVSRDTPREATSPDAQPNGVSGPQVTQPPPTYYHGGRRNRRSNPRGRQPRQSDAAPGQQEMGGGDAPPQQPDVQDMCKKIDGLKL